MTEKNEPAEATEPHHIDLTPETLHCQLLPLPETATERRGSTEAYRVVLPNGRGIGYIRWDDYHNSWEIDPDGAEKYPMRPELRDDAAWLLVKFRDRITPKLKP